jgi:hypothetical protein
VTEIWGLGKMAADERRFTPIRPWVSLHQNGADGAMGTTVRQSVSLPAKVVFRFAKARRVSANRMMVEFIENGVEAEKRRQQEFFDLAERFRAASDPEEVRRLGDLMGRMAFGE